MKKSALSPEMQELADQIGAFTRHWGFKKVHGRIWTHLYLSQEPLDAAELMRRLDISKALVSLSLKELLGFSAIQLVERKSARGTQVYRANPSVEAVILQVLRTREKRMMTRIDGAYRMLKERPAPELAEMRIHPKALKELGEWVAQASDLLDSALAKAPSPGNP